MAYDTPEALLLLARCTEAIHSTALSHPEDCGCIVCRAAAGDGNALTAVLALLEQRP